MGERKRIPLSDAIDLFGHAIVKFDSYYKYSFTFAGPHDGKHLEITVGGDRDEIYRETITGDPVLAKEILEHWFYKFVEVTDQDNRILIWSSQ
jgi:hypothetical protein